MLFPSRLCEELHLCQSRESAVMELSDNLSFVILKTYTYLFISSILVSPKLIKNEV